MDIQLHPFVTNGKIHRVNARLLVHAQPTTEYFRIIGWRDDIETTEGGSTIEMVKEFCYLDLRSFVSNNSSCNKDYQMRIGRANSVYERLKPVWKNKRISLALNLRLYESLVLSVML